MGVKNELALQAHNDEIAEQKAKAQQTTTTTTTTGSSSTTTTTSGSPPNQPSPSQLTLQEQFDAKKIERDAKQAEYFAKRNERGNAFQRAVSTAPPEEIELRDEFNKLDKEVRDLAAAIAQASNI